MRNAAYRQYELERGAMYTVETLVECPTCGELTGCTVNGIDVTITTPCVNECHLDSHFRRDELDDNAVSAAQFERAEAASHGA